MVWEFVDPLVAVEPELAKRFASFCIRDASDNKIFAVVIDLLSIFDGDRRLGLLDAQVAFDF